MIGQNTEWTPLEYSLHSMMHFVEITMYDLLLCMYDLLLCMYDAGGEIPWAEAKGKG